MVRLFKPSQTKSFIRRRIDLPFVRLRFSRNQRPLRYFGLPSEGLYDVVEWSRYIDTVMAVERGDPYSPERKQSLLLSNAINLGLLQRLTLLRGEINKIILSGKDDLGQILSYPFELVNLDYGGSILYPDRIRIGALETFIQKQRGTDFLFLLTLNPREFDSKEIDQTQERMLAEIGQVSRTEAAKASDRIQRINAVSSPLKEILRQTLHVLFMIRGFAEANRYNAIWEPPLVYKGSRDTVLLHYVFDFCYDPSASTKVVSRQGVIDIVNAKLRILKGEQRFTVELSDPLTK